MADEPTVEQKVVFGVSSDDSGTPFVLLGIPAQAWDYMRLGKTHGIDLTKVGIPVKVLIYGAPDHATAVSWIADHNRSLGVPFIDARDENFDLKPPVEGLP